MFYLPYEEPNALNVIIFASFMVLLNTFNYILDNLIHCGLVGQIIIGMIYGVPAGNLLPLDAQKTIMQLGYLGLILMVYEGGLSTPFKTMKENLPLSSLIAITGVSLPIGLSMTLLGYTNASPVASFSAGAALSSTSLGTALTVLSSTGLRDTKVGVLLTNAAVLDDIAGLIMMQVVSNIGDGNFSAASVLRPVFVSLGLIIVVGSFCYFILLPITARVKQNGISSNSVIPFSADRIIFVAHTLVLIGLVIGAIYAGASALTAAYVTGAAISWWDAELLRLRCLSHREKAIHLRNRRGISSEEDFSDSDNSENSESSSEDEIAVCDVQSTTDLGEGSDDGLDEVSDDDLDEGSDDGVDEGSDEDFNEDSNISYTPLEMSEKRRIESVTFSGVEVFKKYYLVPLNTILRPFFFASIGFSIPIKEMFVGRLFWRGLVYAILMLIAKFFCGLWLPISGYMKSKNETSRHCVRSGIYSGALLGFSMIPRGEIGFLISSLAEGKGVFGSLSNSIPSEVYIVVTWAIVICTIFGPIAIGAVVRLYKWRSKEDYDILGIWGLL